MTLMSISHVAPVLQADFEEVRVRRGPRSGLPVAIAVHRTVDGQALGGCRFKPYPSVDDAVRDVELLARAMTFKAGAAGLRVGGGKGVIAAPAGPPLSGEARVAALADFAELVESFGGRYVTAQDVGTSAEDIAYMGRFTSHVAGHPVDQGGSGDPSPYTAIGVEVAIRATLRERLGRPVAGSHIVVVGLGHVGGALASSLSAAGARLTVSDVTDAGRRLASQLGAAWVEPSDALDVEADVLAPCALGGYIDSEAVARLRVPAIAGAANNQLSDDTVADLLTERGILWAPDFVVNAGGLIAVAAEHRAHSLDSGPLAFDRAAALRAIEAIGDTLGEVYRRAEAAGTSTLVAAQELAVKRAAAAAAGGRLAA